MKKAAGLKYKQGDNAPKIIGLGKGHVAEKIIELAQEHNIPIVKEPLLAHELTKLDINLEIPPELYTAVAEILAFIYKTFRDIP